MEVYGRSLESLTIGRCLGLRQVSCEYFVGRREGWDCLLIEVESMCLKGDLRRHSLYLCSLNLVKIYIYRKERCYSLH